VKTKLNELYETKKGRLADMAGGDPIVFVRSYERPEDIEIAGFLAAQFAYGKIELIQRFLRDLFAVTGNRPADYVARGDFSALGNVYYRLHKGPDIVQLLSVLHTIVLRYGSIGRMMRFHYRGDIREALWSVREDLFKEDEGDRLLFFFPKRSSTSALKRWNMYLRWMVRKDDIDFGIWDFISKSDLVIPLDTHLFKIGRCQGWTAQKAQNWKAAREITDALKRVAPEDPLRYDFVLCHAIGISGQCSGARNPSCAKRCVLYEV
jgi:uncharacterized protein (TIGR02757 family)